MKNYTICQIRRAAEYLTGINFWQTESLRFADGPAGLRLQKGKGDSMGLKKSVPATSFPAHSALACGWDRELAYGVARRIGEEAASSGVNILLAPALNIKRSPYNGRNFEYFSEDPCLTGELGAAYVNGVQSTGTGACLKHFAANNKETGRNVSDSVVSERTLAELYLQPFERAVKKARPAAVMTAYNKLNGVYCSQNTRLLGDILRGEWGFDGVVVTDWGGTDDRVASVKAGCDIEMPACRFSADSIVEAYQKGEISAEEIFACVERIERASLATVPKKIGFLYEEHRDYAKKAAAECAVLLKNDGVLPLKKSAKIAVFGEAAISTPMQGGGSSHVIHNLRPTTVLEELSQKFEVVGYKKQLKNCRSHSGLINRADVIVVCISACDGDSEGDDKTRLTIDKKQQKLLECLTNRGKKVVCLLIAGGAIITDWDKDVNALLFTGLAGQGIAAAAAEILCGEKSPCGRLAETFFDAPEELPSTAEFFKSPYYTLYKEGQAIGYGYADMAGVAPRYPFGFGLGYSTFGFFGASVCKDGIGVTVKNVGEFDDAEVVQVYATFPANANGISKKLVAFEKVFLKAGESKKVTIKFDEFAFRSYDAPSHKWVVAGGEYKIYIAKHSMDNSIVLPLWVEGEDKPVAADGTDDLKPVVHKINRDKNGRVIADLSTPIGELKNSRAALIRAAIKCGLHFTRKNATLGGTMRYATVRMGAQFCGFTSRRRDGLVDIFNGRYLKGITGLIFGGARRHGKTEESK